MIRWIIGGLVVLFLFFIGTAFFGSMGYAAGGGTVQLFPKWAESHSESGVAIAVYENQGQITTENTPVPRPQPRNDTADAIVLGAFVVVGAVAGRFLWEALRGTT